MKPILQADLFGSTALSPVEIPADIERKDGADAALLAEIKKAVDGLMTAHEEYKRTNDQRLAEIKAKGVADPLTEQKLVNIEGKLATYEGLNQRLTQAEQAAKLAEADRKDLKDQLDRIETKAGRLPKSAADRAEEIKATVNLWARAVVSANTMGVMNLAEPQRKALDAVLSEWKALNVTTDTAGGYLAPMEYVRELIKSETEISPVRNLARVRTTVMKSVQIPKRTGQFAAQWVAEQGARSETTGLAYGLEELHTHELFALIDISNQMLEDSAFDMEAEIRMEASEQFAVAEGAAFVTGNGVGKPEGFLSNASVSTTNSGAATAVAADGLLSLYYAIKTAYARNSTWAANRTTIGSIRKLKDSTNQYLWVPGLATGVPNTINGAPYVEVPDMPNEGAGTKPVAFGDFRRAYTWVDRLVMEMLRDPFTQATSGNVRFILRKRVAGQVVLPEAIRALVCST
jgi:HK97 family phage major capsid protein